MTGSPDFSVRSYANEWRAWFHRTWVWARGYVGVVGLVVALASPAITYLKAVPILSRLVDVLRSLTHPVYDLVLPLSTGTKDLLNIIILSVLLVIHFAVRNFHRYQEASFALAAEARGAHDRAQEAQESVGASTGVGAFWGGVIGFFVGGPAGAAVGAVVGAAAGAANEPDTEALEAEARAVAERSHTERQHLLWAAILAVLRLFLIYVVIGLLFLAANYYESQLTGFMNWIDGPYF